MSNALGKLGIARHMRDALETMQTHMRNIDLVLEVRDARIPLSSINPEFESLVRHKRRLVLFNKMDLAAPGTSRLLGQYCKATGELHHCTALAEEGRSGMDKLISLCHSTIVSPGRTLDLAAMMVVGVPNCGKSTLINALKDAAIEQGFLPASSTKRYGGKARAAPLPGVTRHVSSFQVADRPRLFVLDTPGIALPKAAGDLQAYRLALTGAVPDAALGHKALVAFLAASLASGPQRKRLQAALQDAELRMVEAQHTMAQLRDDFVAQEAERMLVKNQRSKRGSQEDAAAGPGPGSLEYARAVREVSGSDRSRHFPRPREFTLLGERLSFLRFLNEGLGREGRGRLDEGLQSDARGLVEWVAEGPLKGFVAKERCGDDEGKEQALYVRLLQAYRTGKLGLYTLDDVAEATTAANSRQTDEAKVAGAQKRPREVKSPTREEHKRKSLPEEDPEFDPRPGSDLSLEQLRRIWKE